MKTVKIVYVGELSGVVIPELDNPVIKRGEPVEVPEEWAQKRIKFEPKRWKLAASAKQQVYAAKEVE